MFYGNKRLLNKIKKTPQSKKHSSISVFSGIKKFIALIINVLSIKKHISTSKNVRVILKVDTHLNNNTKNII